MARIQPFFDDRLDVGPAVAPLYLAAWQGERERMNLEAQKAKGDPADLAAQEAKLRDTVAKMRRDQLSFRRSVMKEEAGLAKEALRAGASIYERSLAESGATARAKLGAKVNYAKLAAGMNAAIGKSLEIEDDTIKAPLDEAYRTATSKTGARGAALVGNDMQRGALAQHVDDLLAKAGRPMPGTPQHDAIVARAYKSIPKSDSEARKAFSALYGGGEDFDEYMTRNWSGITADDMKAYYEKQIDPVSSGGKWRTVDEIAKVAQGYGGGGGTEGMSMAASGGMDPDDPRYEDTIKKLEDSADALARQRASIMASSSFPRANALIANPNIVRDEQDMRTLAAWGRLEPEYVSEVVTEMERTGSLEGAKKAIAARGGLDSEGAREFDAEILLTDDDMPDYGAAFEKAVKEGLEVADEGGYRYKVGEKGIEIVAAPKGKESLVGKLVKKDDPRFVPMMGVLYPKLGVPGMKDAPDAVGALYAPALARLAAGDVTGAVKSARSVNKDDVRAAWGGAIKSAASGGRPYGALPLEQQMVALTSGVESLPEGGWQKKYKALLVDPVKSAPEAGRRRTEFERLGEALMAGGGAREERAQRARTDYPLGEATGAVAREEGRKMAEAAREPRRRPLTDADVEILSGTMRDEDMAQGFREGIYGYAGEQPIMPGLGTAPPVVKAAAIEEPPTVYSRVGTEPMRLGYPVQITDYLPGAAPVAPADIPDDDFDAGLDVIVSTRKGKK